MWSAALAAALISHGDPYGGKLVDVWRTQPRLRLPMLQACAYAAATPEQKRRRLEGDYRLESTVRNLGQDLCRGPERPEFIALFARAIPADSPVRLGIRRAAGHVSTACDEWTP